jgi:hypothetical protein
MKFFAALITGVIVFIISILICASMSMRTEVAILISLAVSLLSMAVVLFGE